ncbi:acyl-CoA thioesterase [Umezakia ovalisporum]|jgi:1,4-dihydroxy-2-naphthoyl-CoA hydrolase|uniref:1,4-dihydroxy-2-naphthoyl-CoA hydrolase n=2 Tax=Umezakia ovalisporum TaxID=75695 RepID=A0AA43GWZ4_9CYAN|nr:thioesterase family protein [Umezakia ovalisporum]MDH6055692.1 acyl-CoA thioesterase [Umezakia ovalisporum FSS-43]MDH6062358.1 acyl-CoA thioesterase [Umezakia ovalisporum FSS-62]MDH6068233.1 acyl-CoA thioesterase [Umezakia ovalisporum APH033B]MDH6069365.1 acyl-CoA thioesterase [Umezakia ovalisporum CobakiLakeA]MDH6073640.1 acyl-CoA thioesterase [Umezakia ovalisporum CS-1034]
MSFTYNRAIRLQDTDAAGVIYFANVLCICHEAYEASLEASGIHLKSFFTHPSVAFPIIHANVDFFRPLFCGDKLEISLIPHKLGVNKFEVIYEIIVQDVLVAKAVTRHACIDAISRSKQNLSDEMIQWLETNRRESQGEERRKLREIL